jgi:aerobic carbon-monoxide dehydrogenase medium subunit
MKPAPFEYHAPETVEEACALLAEYGDDAKVLAGGQSLVPMLALRLTRFEHLVDVNRVRGLAAVTRENGALVVGAGARQRVMERDAAVADAVPLLAAATPLIGHFQIRNRGTVCGSLAHADPASEYPAVAVALGAELELTAAGGRSRRVAADDFFVGTWTTAVEPDELLTAVRFPVRAPRSACAIEELARRHGDFALVGVACAAWPDHAAVVLFGVGSTPIRATDAAAELHAGSSAADVAEAAVRDLDPPGDVHASAQTRTRIARHLVERAAARVQEGLRAAG